MEMLTRREILTAGAWSAPVIAVAVATPVAAASTTSARIIAHLPATTYTGPYPARFRVELQGLPGVTYPDYLLVALGPSTSESWGLFPSQVLPLDTSNFAYLTVGIEERNPGPGSVIIFSPVEDVTPAVVRFEPPGY